MNADTELRGIHVPLITPFDEHGELAADALRALAHEVLDQGAAGLVALGTTAEPAALEPGERAEVVRICAEVCRERGARLTVGVEGGSTRAVVAALAGLGGPGALPAGTLAMTLVPPFVRPGAAGVLAHFQELTATSPVPLIIYHIPYRTGQELDAAALLELAELPGVAGVKYAGGRIDTDAVMLLAARPDRFAVLAADDALLSPLLALGAAGGIMASAHLATDRFAELVELWAAGQAARARELGHRLAVLSAACFAAPNPAVVKGVLHAQGRIPSLAVRLPLLPADAAAVAAATSALDRVTAPAVRSTAAVGRATAPAVR
ncbi:4-hydroxy-tetrahydrodipicolinate synthase [Streptomyces tateyamensis]|uniref:4-hydroxy-tetrahydrodipicolinate synthase n=1 Tax=Streptomyces tateyamensis TaxID=565073 RepID=A0A2V4P2G6_9ACTN|nr:dihydrodipicolinate synthase family protein [Streptomyces tateyamensis]PYC87745.1 4-hydroxy-tetrahydrodipicolinate synthase [Streptomyces tateyamensis]